MSVINAYINDDFHLILVLSNGIRIDAGCVVMSEEPSNKEQFVVTFVDYDGSVLDVQAVKSGESALPPEDPVRDGYVFAGWEGTYTEVTSDCTVTATYSVAILRYNVVFLDHDGIVLSSQSIVSGNDATPPEEPTRAGYVFAGWAGTYTNVSSDCTIVATYTANVSTPAIIITEQVAERGCSNVVITVGLKQNPGVASLKLLLEYDDTVLTLNRIVYNSEIGGQALMPQFKESPLTLNWFNGTENATGDFVFATLYFSITNTANTGNYSITVSYDANDVYNFEETNLDFAIINGKIIVVE